MAHPRNVALAIKIVLSNSEIALARFQLTGDI